MADPKATTGQEIRKACSVEGCNGGHVWAGMCARHRHQMKTKGKIWGNPCRPRRSPNEITIDGDLAYIILYDNNGKAVDRAIIDALNVDKCREHRWVRHGSGYVASGNVRNKIKLHRFLLGLTSGDGWDADHANQNRLDNRMENIRACSRSQNLYNRPAPKNNTSGFKGVGSYWRNGRWQATIKVDNQDINLGMFDTKEEAALAYNEAALKYHKEFAYLNKVDMEK
jgi:hypothetical protein